MCQLCDHGFCPRHHLTASDWLHFDPCYVTDSEREQERREEWVSRPEFEKPLGRAA